MDLKMFYDKIRGVESSIGEDPAVVVSNETSDGGKPGMKTEVSRAQAARLIVEGRARLATMDEAAMFRRQMKEAREQAEQEAQARRVQFALISEQDLKGIRGAKKV